MPVGVTTRKKIIPIIIGEIIVPKIKPNFIHTLFKGVNNLELKIPKIKKIIDISKDQNLKFSLLRMGHNPINKKTIKKTIPKFLLVGNLLFMTK